jgi:hypothetical protein
MTDGRLGEQTAALHDPSVACFASVVRHDITPPVGIYSRMWGAALHDCATAVHRPLLATALAMADDGTATAGLKLILALDVCVLGKDECEEIFTALFAAVPALRQREQLVLTMSHSHSAIAMRGTQEETTTSLPGGQHLRPYFEEVLRTCVRAGMEAVGSLAPVWITFGQGVCELAKNRDTWDRHSAATAPPGAGTTRSAGPTNESDGAERVGQWVCGYGAQEGRPADTTLMVGRVTARATATAPRPAPADPIATGVTNREEQPVLATLLNYGCHPTTLGPGSVHLSPDYIGAARQVVEDQFGGIAVFLQGACGDTGPVISYAADPAAADRNGRILGYAAAAALEALLPPGAGLEYAGAIVSGATLAGWHEAALEPDARGASGLLRSSVVSVRMPLNPQLSAAEAQGLFDAAEVASAAAHAQRGEGSVEYRDARAIEERWRRSLQRIATRPAADAGATHFDCPVTLMQLGPQGAFLVCVPGEPYQALQVDLRARFPEATILLAVLCNVAGELTYYLPEGKVGQGTYQDELMMVQAGSLELMVDAIATQLASWGAGGGVREVVEEEVEEVAARL